MKVIDLLNKKANGEEVPEKIKAFGYEWLYEPLKTSNIPYYSGGYNIVDFFKLRSLNDEVEIIEDKPMLVFDEEDKEIEELEVEKLLQTKKWKRDRKAWNKINELIKAVNELKKGK